MYVNHDNTQAEREKVSAIRTIQRRLVRAAIDLPMIPPEAVRHLSAELRAIASSMDALLPDEASTLDIGSPL